jgi:hypothetical protein
MEATSTLALFAIVAAMGLIGVVAIEVVSTQQATAAPGCLSTLPRTNGIIGYNASKGRCYNS